MLKVSKKISYDSCHKNKFFGHMTFKSSDVVNLHSFYSYLPQANTPFSFDKTSEHLTPIELACIQGNVEELQYSLNYSNDGKQEQHLLKALRLSIENSQLKCFEILLQSPLVAGIIQRHIYKIRDYILSSGQLAFLGLLEQHTQKVHHHCYDSPSMRSLEIALKQLHSYYHSSLNAKSLSQHRQIMLDTLSGLYHQDKAKLANVELPLDFEAFLHLKSLIDEKSLRQIYKKHAIHTAWRLMHPNEDWFEDESMLAQLLHQHAWLVILMWLAASDEHLQLAPVKLSERITLFFHRLSQVCGNSNQIQKELFQCVIGHPYNQLLTEDIVIYEQERFLQQHYIKCLALLSFDQLHELLALTKTRQIAQRPEYFQAISVSKEEYQTFYQRMASRFGQQWQSNTTMIDLSKEMLTDTENLIRNQPRILIESIKYVCQQLNIQPNLPFFARKPHTYAITSINPITTDERVPLSYGVPERPKS